MSERAFTDGKIKITKARSVLTFVCRIPKNLVASVFNEMEEHGWIEFENKMGNHFLIVKKKVNCTIIPRNVGRDGYGDWS